MTSEPVADRWIVEVYAHTDIGYYPQWQPIEDATYYWSQDEAQAAMEARIDADFRRAVEGWKKDVRECAERAAVYEKARSAVEGMPAAHILSSSYRTKPIPEPEPGDKYASRYRVARVTPFQERVAALLAEYKGADTIDTDELRECFAEAAQKPARP